MRKFTTGWRGRDRRVDIGIQRFRSALEVWFARSLDAEVLSYAFVSQ